jgi:hypothetical protein
MIERAAAGAGLELKAHPHMLRDACGSRASKHVSASPKDSADHLCAA